MGAVQRLCGEGGRVSADVQYHAPAAALEEFLDRGEGNSDDPLSSPNNSLQCFFV